MKHLTLLALAATLGLLAAYPAGATAQTPGEPLKAEATAARERNDGPVALELYAKALGADPQWVEGWWFLGTLHYHADEYGAAGEALSRYLALKPGAGPAMALRGLCEFETGDYTHALEDIERGLTLGAANKAGNAQILAYHEAMIYTLRGEYERALTSYAAVAHAGAMTPPMIDGLGLAGLRMAMLPKDVPATQREMVRATGEAAAQVEAGDTEAGERAFEGFFGRFPTNGEAHYLMGYLLFASDPDTAMAQFEQAIAVTPANARARAMLAWGWLMRADPGKALPFAERTAADAPALHLGQLVLGRSLVETGKTSEGLVHLRRALAMQPDDLETHLALAKAYASGGQEEEARGERLRCLALTQEQSSVAR